MSESYENQARNKASDPKPECPVMWGVKNYTRRSEGEGVYLPWAEAAVTGGVTDELALRRLYQYV